MTAHAATPPAEINRHYSTEIKSGRFVDLSNPRPEQFDLESIAAGLSKVCRYAGQSHFFYTVAEHAYWVSKRLEWIGLGADVQLAGLHHDDAEAIMGDVTTPMKRYLAHREEVLLQDITANQARILREHLDGVIGPRQLNALVGDLGHSLDTIRRHILAELEEALLAAILPGIGLYPGDAPIEHPAVKNADLWALAGEAKQLTHSGGENWAVIGEYDPHPDLASIGLSSERAETLWLSRHHELLTKLRTPRGGHSHV